MTTLDTLDPDPTFDPDAHAETVSTLADLRDDDTDVTVRVWGADWCGDCRAVLPGFAAAMEAAGLTDAMAVYPVDREKRGDLVVEYDVELIPTVVVEVDGEAVARFVESEPVPAATYLADQVAGRAPTSE